jgi:hypothetical protein
MGWSEGDFQQISYCVGIEFFHDVGAVRFNGFDADAQVIGNLFVQAACHDAL